MSVVRMSCSEEHVHIRGGSSPLKSEGNMAYICYDLKSKKTKWGLLPSKDCVDHDGGEFKESPPNVGVPVSQVA